MHALEKGDSKAQLIGIQFRQYLVAATVASDARIAGQFTPAPRHDGEFVRECGGSLYLARVHEIGPYGESASASPLKRAALSDTCNEKYFDCNNVCLRFAARGADRLRKARRSCRPFL